MPIYAYKGVTDSGKTTKGTLSAESSRAARAKMRSDGIFLTELNESAGESRSDSSEESSGFSFDFSSFQRIPAMERAIATRQLATLIGAGIPLVTGLTALVQQIEHARLKAVFAQVRDRVNEGASLADSLAATNQFDNLYISMIRAGEESGALETVLARVADYLEDQIRLANRVTSIMIYPAVMMSFAGVVVVALVTLVLPQITGLLESLDQPLPFYTIWVINGSEFLRSYWWALGLALVAFAFGMRALLRNERGRAFYDRTTLRLPIFGRVGRVLAIARFCRTLSTLLASGVGIVRALDISRHVANNAVIAEAINDSKVAVIEGASLATTMRASGEFPPLVTTMIEVGEQSGDLEAMLAKVAVTYDEQVENTLSRLTSLLEPALILLMVGIVLVIILATLMPLMQITGSLA